MRHIPWLKPVKFAQLYEAIPNIGTFRVKLCDNAMLNVEANAVEMGHTSMAQDEIAVAQAVPGDEFNADAEAYNALKALEERRKKRRRSRNIKIGVVAAVAAVAAAVALGAGQFLQPQEEEGPAVPETAVVSREDFSTSIESSGSLQAASSVTVTPEVEGLIQEIYVAEGDNVVEGSTLFTMTSPELDKAVDEAYEGVVAADSDLAEARSAVSAMESAYSQAKKAHDKQQKQADKDAAKARKKGEAAKKKAYDKAVKAIPKNATKAERKELVAQAKEDAQAAYDKAYAAVPITTVDEFDESSYIDQIQEAKGSVSTAQGALDTAQRTYDQAVADLSKCTVTAPKGGTVVSLTTDTGTSSGDDPTETSSATVKIADLSQMKVSVEVNEIDISSIEVGQRARVGFSAFPDLELEGKVSEIASAASGSDEGYGGDGGIVTFRVDVVIDKPDPQLKPGMTASVEILTQDIPDALCIPVSALSEEEDGIYVDVVTDEENFTTEHRKVKVKAQSASTAVIKKGLKEDEVVVVGGAAGMDDDDYDGDEDYEDEGEGLVDLDDIGFDE